MYPTREQALEELRIAGELNPGVWTDHCKYAAQAAELIAGASGMDAEKAYVCGLLHDIGRRTGIAQMRHIIDGYDYMMSKGWDEVARICLTHSFPIPDIEKDLSKVDITEEQYAFVRTFLEGIEYDFYDKLIILCDGLADKYGLCILEKRHVDIARRYGVFPFTVERWNKTYDYKDEFEAIIGRSIYTLFPNIEQCIYTQQIANSFCLR